MAIKRPAPKTLSEAAQNAITSASANQTGQTARVKSYDPDYPVFDVPINQKVLVYIPNHRVTYPDGSIGLRMDKFAAHPVIDGRSYGDIRCTQGIVEESLGLDGTCPLCDGINECWDLYNKQYADVARSKGIAVDAPEAQEALKSDRIDLVKAMAIKQADVWMTFPIVVIECEEKNGQMTTQPKIDSEGKIHGTPMWYSIRERTFQEKWVAGYDSIDVDSLGEVPTSPAGLWAILNFTYTPQSGKHDKMGSARALKVIFKTMSDSYTQWAEYFDKLTEDWTPAKAMEVVVLDVVRDMNEMKEVADTLLKPVREKLAMYDLAAGRSPSAPVAGALPSSADDALASFGVEPAQPAGAVPAQPAGATPAQPTGAVPAQPAGAPVPNLTTEMPNVGVSTE